MKGIVLTIDDLKQIKPVKNYLEQHNWLNKSKKIEKSNGFTLIYTTLQQLDGFLQKFSYKYYEYETIKNDFESRVRQYLIDTNLYHESIIIPKKYSIYPPLILFSNWFNIDIDEKLYRFILDVISDISNQKLTHIALNQPIIKSDIMRRPFNITPLFGDFGPHPSDQVWDNPQQSDFDNAFWCHVTQNGIYQTWSPKFTMFSRGNIKEKNRVLTQLKNINQSIVFDLYCGIGYFSLSYLKAGAQELFGWELNPWSIEGFIRGLNGNHFTNFKVFTTSDEFNYEIYLNLKLNGIKIFLFQENNQNALSRLSTFPENSLNISHVNLGLLPSSQPSWPLAQQIVESYNYQKYPQIHIHENVHINQFELFQKQILNEFKNGKILHLEKVKTFAPDVWHIVVDLELETSDVSTID